MRRATTPTHIFTFPPTVNVDDIEKVLISYSQCGNIVLEKKLGDVVIDPVLNTASIKLTMSETNLFAPGKALVQARIVTKNLAALASQIIWINVKPAINSEVYDEQ